MRTPDRVTTETFKRPASQIAEHLARVRNPLKPVKAAASKTRQKGDRKRPKAKPQSPDPNVIKKIIGGA